MAMSLTVPAVAYADSGYINEGPGVALDQKGKTGSGVINRDPGSQAEGPGAVEEPGESVPVNPGG